MLAYNNICVGFVKNLVMLHILHFFMNEQEM